MRQHRMATVAIIAGTSALASLALGRHTHTHTHTHVVGIRDAYSAAVSATYDYHFGRGAPFQPSNALTENGGFIPAAAFPSAAYCGHCHAAAYREWRDSLHRNAFREPFYQNNVKLLIDTKGVAFTRHCEGCHNPIALFSGALTAGSHADRSFDADGLTCSVCHAIQKLEPMVGNGAYVMGVPAVMVDAAGKRIPGEVPDAEILAHPERHRAAVMQPFYRSPEFCGACHESTLPVALTGHDWLRGFQTFDEWQQSAYSNRTPVPFYAKAARTCQDCHMPPTAAGPGEAGARGGLIASHRWAAGNTAVPFYYGLPAQLQKTASFLRSQKLQIDIFGLKPGPSGALAAPLGDVPAALRAGQTAQAYVLVQNTGLGHSLIPEQRDFYQAWIRFTVSGAGGRNIWQSGGLLRDGTLDPAAHSFTSRLIAADGAALRDHQIWLRRAVAYDSTVPSGHSALVRYEFRVPPGAQGAITLTAAVEYRHFNQHYLDHVLGANHPAYPVIEMASASRAIPVGRVARPENPSPVLPDEFLRLNNFGIALLDEGSFAEARAAFERAAAIDPASADTDTNIAIADLQLSDFNVGRRAADRALALARANPRAAARALYYRGLIERNQDGGLAASVRDLEAVARRYPESREALHQLGVSAYLARGDAEARGAFASVLANDPYDLLAHFYLSVLDRRAGLARQAARQAALYQEEKPAFGQGAIALAYLRNHPADRPESVAGHVHVEPGLRPGKQ